MRLDPVPNMMPKVRQRTEMLSWYVAERARPSVARRAPVMAVVLSPTLSVRTPARKERKKVDPMANDPTREHLKAASSSPAASRLAFSLTKRIPKVLMILKTTPLTMKEQTMTSQACKTRQ